MTKADIVNEIAKTTGIDKPAVLSVVEQFMTVVKDSLAHGENVYLRGFGSFIVKTRAEKTARNISKNTTLVIPAHNIPAFKPANSFKNEVAKCLWKKKKTKRNSPRSKPSIFNQTPATALNVRGNAVSMLPYLMLTDI